MEYLIDSFQLLSSPMILLSICFGVVAGVIFGALPGISSTMAIILCISFTYTMEPVHAIAFMSAIYCSAVTGGGITAVLFQIPGTAASVATTFDGYPLTLRGEAGKALSLSLYSSAIGGMFSACVMFVLTIPLMRVAMKFGASELFAITFLGLSVLIILDEDHMLTTLISGLCGLWLATVGLDYYSAVPRFTFGTKFLLNGIEVLPTMVGMFALAEIFKEISTPANRNNVESVKLTKLISLKEMWTLRWDLLRSSVIGCLVGILPGTGASIASFMSYTVAVKTSKTPEKFGHGALEGIVASETANNAATGGTMVPLLSMGIPGGNAAAMMMAALSMHGVQMGPMLLRNQPEYLSTVFLAIAFANIFMVLVSFIVAKIFAKILGIPYYMLGSLILLLSVVGSYASSGSMDSVYVMIIAGVFGYFFTKFKFNNAALVLGLVLGSMCENQLRRALTLTHGNVWAVVSRPITATILLLFLIMYMRPLVKIIIKKYRNVRSS